MAYFIPLQEWLNDWLPWIYADLQIVGKDQQVLRNISQRLSTPIRLPTPTRAKAIVLGSGSSLEHDLQKLQAYDLSGITLVTADGATNLVLEYGFMPEWVFTDLDGLGLDALEALPMGCILFVLIHEDNLGLLEAALPVLRSRKVVWCTQNEPIPGFVNTIGFTDGDRPVNQLLAADVKTLLLGFDLYDDMIGKTSKPELKGAIPMNDRKATKLAIAARILATLSDRSRLIYTIGHDHAPGIVTSLDAFLH